MGYVSNELFSTTPARLGLTGAYAQVSVGWKEIHAVAERFPCIGIQMRLLCDKKRSLKTFPFVKLKNTYIIFLFNIVIIFLFRVLLSENSGADNTYFIKQ